jgi:hypothetical protein
MPHIHQNLAEVVIKFQVQRIEFDSATRMRDGLIGAADPGKFQAEPMMSSGKVRIKFQSAAVLALPIGPFPFRDVILR